MTRFGVIGTGAISRVHSDAWRALPVDLMGYYDIDHRASERAVDVFGGTAFDSIDALVENVDMVDVCTPGSAHVKPVARHVADAMIQICRQRGSQLQIAFPVRFHPVFAELKRMLDRRDLGNVLSVECTNHGSMLGDWFIVPARSGGGAVIDHTVHVIDLLRWFWGTEVAEVFARAGESLIHPDLGIDDAGLLSLTLANLVYGTLDTSWSRPPSYTTWGDFKIEVVAEGGVVYADMSRQHVSVSSNQAGQTRWHAWGGDMDVGLIQDFADEIRRRRALN